MTHPYPAPDDAFAAAADAGGVGERGGLRRCDIGGKAAFFVLGRGLTLPDILPGLHGHKGKGIVLAQPIIMADRYLEAIQCLNLIAPERFAEALETADARAGLRTFQEGCDPGLMEIVFSVPDEQFWWFRLVLRKMAEKYERHKSIVQTYRKLNLPRS